MKMKRFIVPCFAAVLCAILLFASCDDRLMVENNPNITRMFLVGDALKGWTDYDKSPLAEPMLRTGGTTFVYRGNLSAGFFKISCDEIPDWDGKWFLPQKTDTVLTDGSEFVMRFSVSGDGGETGAKWQITKSSLYTISIDKSTRTIKCEEDVSGEFIPTGTNDIFTHMWLIVCRPEAPYPYAMTRTSDNWTITRDLRNGEYIKFYGEAVPRTDWDSPYSLKWFCSLADGESALDSALNTGTRKFKYGADNTLSWLIPNSPQDQRSYTITLRPREGTVTFERKN